MRNGDYHPTRLLSQKETLSHLFTSKSNANQESQCGLISLAGASPKVLSTLTHEHGKFLRNVHQMQLSPDTHLLTAISIGQLLLKHRSNKNQKQRLVVFIGHAIEATQEDLVKLAKKLKKNSVAVDVISFGECVANQGNRIICRCLICLDKLEAFVAVFGEGSRLVSVPQGDVALVEGVQMSGVFGQTGGQNAESFEFGVDPELDPELALALRLSMEEENGRANEGAVESKQPMDTEETEEEMMQRALMMSMGEDEDETMELLKDVEGVDEEKVKDELNKK